MQKLHGRIISLRWEVWDHITSLTPPLFIEVHIPSQKVRDHVLVASILSILLRFFFSVLDLFRQCGILCFRSVPTVQYFVFQICSDRVVFCVLDLFRQWGSLCFRSVPTVRYFVFQICSDSVVFCCFHFIDISHDIMNSNDAFPSTMYVTH